MGTCRLGEVMGRPGKILLGKIPENYSERGGGAGRWRGALPGDQLTFLSRRNPPIRRHVDPHAQRKEGDLLPGLYHRQPDRVNKCICTCVHAQAKVSG